MKAPSVLMAELTPHERLQPSLLDRLTDKAPESKTESRDHRVLSMQRLRQAVLRDLAWLLNTGHLETTEDLDDYPQVRSSVLNYGMPDITGLTASSTNTPALEKAVREAIIRFEPRISQNSLRVKIDTDAMVMGRNTMIKLFLKTEVDLETGDIAVTDR